MRLSLRPGMTASTEYACGLLGPSMPNAESPIASCVARMGRDHYAGIFCSAGGTMHLRLMVAACAACLVGAALCPSTAPAQEEVNVTGRRICGGEKTDIKNHAW